MRSIQKALEEVGIPARDLLECPSSTKTFPDGAHYRLEIAGIESAEALKALISEANVRRIPIHRVIGMVGGATFVTKAELREYSAIARKASLEVIVNPGPGRFSDGGRQIASPEGVWSGLRIRGSDNLHYLISDVLRCVQAGLRGFLVLDEGVLFALNHLRSQDYIPAKTKFKVSVFAGHGNPAGIKVIEQLGADSVNPLSDLTLPMLAAIRSACNIPLDIYISIVDSMGGASRLWEAAELVRICSPCYLKIEPGPSESTLYKPWVTLESQLNMVSTKLHLAELAQEYIADLNPELRVSASAPKDLAVPEIPEDQ